MNTDLSDVEAPQTGDMERLKNSATQAVSTIGAQATQAISTLGNQAVSTLSTKANDWGTLFQGKVRKSDWHAACWDVEHD